VANPERIGERHLAAVCGLARRRAGTGRSV